MSGSVGGLVAITPACGFVGPMGAIAGAVYLWGVNGLKHLLRADDALDVFGVHGAAGIVGALLTGVFASPALGGAGVYDYVNNHVAPYDMGTQMLSQLLGVVVTIVWSGAVSLLSYALVDRVFRLRANEEQEQMGLDLASHGENAYRT